MLANLLDNVVLYFNILQTDCRYIDHTMELYFFTNVTFSQLIFISIYLHTDSQFSINSSFL